MREGNGKDPWSKRRLLSEGGLDQASLPGTNAPVQQPGVRERSAAWLKEKGQGLIQSSEAEGVNGWSGFKKYGKETLGQGMVSAGTLAEELPTYAQKASHLGYGLATLDGQAYKDATLGGIGAGKAYLQDTWNTGKNALSNWGSALSDQPTTYQTLKATGGTIDTLAHVAPLEGAATKVASMTGIEGISGAGKVLATGEVASVTEAAEASGASRSLAAAENAAARSKSMKTTGMVVEEVAPEQEGLLLKKKLSNLQDAQAEAARTRTLPDGRIRYYEAERPASKPGPTRGASYVTEWDPETNITRTWNESYGQDGNVVRVRPKNINGQEVISQHYPPTGKEIDEFNALQQGRSGP